MTIGDFEFWNDFFDSWKVQNIIKIGWKFKILKL